MDPIVTVRAPFWNLIALGLPLAAFLIGLMLLSSRGGNDYAGRLGGGILLVLGLAVASGLGVVAGGVALYRQEKFAWLSVLGIILNLLVCLPVVAVFLKK